MANMDTGYMYKQGSWITFLHMQNSTLVFVFLSDKR